ncbi:outer membrane protein OmpK [Pseudomonas aeruginosa]|nr:outer membrane protein OmpK [Pseudomonas aeruginosa]
MLDLYGYIDYKNLFDDASSDVPDGENWFVDIEPRLSIDRLLGRDFSIGPIREWFVAFDYYYADARQGPGLNVLWSGIGTNTELPWLGTVGLNLYARYIDKNYGASNENAWDGYVAHMNWFKPLAQFGGKRFIAFQGFFDYEFGSKLPDKDDAFEHEYRTDNGFQAYLGLWYHTEHWKFGYGAKVYRNMTQWRDGEQLDGRRTDSSGIGHYFNVGYAF